MATLGGEKATDALSKRVQSLLSVANREDADEPAKQEASDDTTGYMSTEALLKAGF